MSTKVIFVKLIILTVGHQIILIQPTYDINYDHPSQGYLKVKVILRSRSFQNQVFGFLSQSRQ